MIKTNFYNAVVVAKRFQEPSSPYAPLMKDMKDNLNKVIDNGTTPQYVAEVCTCCSYK